MSAPPAIAPSAVVLVANDLPRTLSFYRALGLDIPADADGAEHVEIDLAPGFRLMVDPVETVHAYDSAWTAPSGSARASLAFDCGTPAGVDEKYAAMVAAGFEGHLAPWDAFWRQRYASLRDPDGTGVDLFAALPAG